jgi:hypothetical protein
VSIEKKKNPTVYKERKKERDKKEYETTVLLHLMRQYALLLPLIKMMHDQKY